MAGLRTLQVQPYSPDFPEQLLQCHLGLSYLLTAAGQFRTLAGFPIHTPGEGSDHGIDPLYLDESHLAQLQVVDISIPSRMDLSLFLTNETRAYLQSLKSRAWV